MKQFLFLKCCSCGVHKQTHALGSMLRHLAVCWTVRPTLMYQSASFKHTCCPQAVAALEFYATKISVLLWYIQFLIPVADRANVMCNSND